MDASALIFVALAIAWAAYLIPKALEHHEEGIRSRTVERFSTSMRVIARREPVGRGRAELVTPRRTQAAAPAAVVRRGRAPVSPARRRRRVLGLVLLANAVVVGLAAVAIVAWTWVAAPVGLLVAWLLACRVMVKRERGVRRPARPTLEQATAVVAQQAEQIDPAAPPVVDLELHPTDLTEEQAAITADGTWDPQQVPLPTYVSKPPAPRRSVRTIDLDATGVWTSGRSEIDSELVREADEAARAAKAQAESRSHLG